MRFLGTGAADVIPCPLCSCPLCEDARRDPARGRFRSMFQLDEENLIDCGPEFAAAGIRFGLSFEKLKNVFITHTHEDHLDLSNAGFVRNSRTRSNIPVEVYLSEAGYDYVMTMFEAAKDRFPSLEGVRGILQDSIHLHPVSAGIPFTAGGYSVLPVNTSHRVSPTETALNYRFEKDGVSLLYACDTGLYLPESIDLLANSRLDYLIMEGTWGDRTDKSTATHLNAFAFLDQLNTFTAHGIIDDHTQVFVSHINHMHSMTHEDYQRFMDQRAGRPVTVAWDGLTI